MNTRVLLAAVLALGAAAPALAHRFNEYLQATTIAVGHDSLTLQVRLMPGVDVASTVIAGIDADHDGTLSSAEAQACAEGVLRDLSLALDARRASCGCSRGRSPHFPTWQAGIDEYTGVPSRRLRPVLASSIRLQCFATERKPRRAAIVTRSGSESAFILRMT